MKDNPGRSLNLALKVCEWIQAENKILVDTLKKNPDLTDEFQLLLAEMTELNVARYEAVCEVIALLSERQDIFQDGIEKVCRYEQ